MSHSKSQIKKAGKILKHKDSHTKKDIKFAEDALTYWRSIHEKIINEFHQIVQEKVKEINEESFVAQRLKRSPSIIAKLQRLSNIQLTTMQDIAGVRAVVKDLGELRLLQNRLKEDDIPHELKGEDNYLEKPKNSGYRGIHLVYKYNDSKDRISNGLLVEVQVRTKLQHAWATAVETMGTYLGTNLKFNEGQPKWLKYFALTSSAFSFIEKTNKVPKYEKLSKYETFELALYEFKYNKIADTLTAYSVVTNFICKESDADNRFHLILLDIDNKTLKVQSFREGEFERANQKYTELERKYSTNSLNQVVLVSTESIHDLRNAFPNYFLDTKDFLRNMKLIQKMFNEMKNKSA